MKQKSLTAEYVRSILNYDSNTGIFTWKKKRHGVAIGKIPGRIHPVKKNRDIGIDNKRYAASRLAWLYITGEWPLDQIDHINGISDDDRFCNLREATNQENLMNRRVFKNNKLGHKGIYKEKDSSYFRATIVLSGKRVWMGKYLQLEDAIKAREEKLHLFHGEFSRL